MASNSDLYSYELTQEEKEALFRRELPALSARHRAGCEPYAALCRALSEDTPLLPVSAFRERELYSVPRENIVRILTSSGTSGQQPSQIFLDEKGALQQQKALLAIGQEFIGKERLPMLIIDSKSVFSKPSYTARAAGIAGFSIFSTKRVFALDEEMRPDPDAICRFAEHYAGQKVLLFGFTYMIRQYFTLPLLQAGLHPDLSGAVLIHGGGWKKMSELAVSPEQFREELHRAAGITDIHNYYGMAEQLGGIFMECECGHLHAPACSDIRFLRPEDFSACQVGEQGIVSLVSLLPASYPGHRLLTEDLGRLLGEDDCPCGRKGRYFAIDGRVPHAEIRGCSDTYAADDTYTAKDMQAADDAHPAEGKHVTLTCLAGEFPVSASPTVRFSEETMAGLAAFSEFLLHDPACRQWPEIVSFGFWIRKAHLEQLQERYEDTRTGIGHVLISAPANMPVLFAYNWACAMLSGCSCTIRLSERTAASTDLLCEKIRVFLSAPEHKALRSRTAIVRFPRSDDTMAVLSSDADARVIWGGDETVRHLSSIPAKPGCRDILFPDRYGISVLSAAAIAALSDEELRLLCDRFYRDTYEADQNACSSARVVFWIDDSSSVQPPVHRINESSSAQSPMHTSEEVRTRFWNTLASIVSSRWHPEAETLLAKYSLLVRQAMEIKGLTVGRYAGNLLYTAALPVVLYSKPTFWESLEARAGLFFEAVLPSLQDLPEDLGDRLQTATVYGFETNTVKEALQKKRSYPALRTVPVGAALEFDPVWDNQDLIQQLLIAEKRNVHGSFELF